MPTAKYHTFHGKNRTPPTPISHLTRKIPTLLGCFNLNTTKKKSEQYVRSHNQNLVFISKQIRDSKQKALRIAQTRSAQQEHCMGWERYKTHSPEGMPRRKGGANIIVTNFVHASSGQKKRRSLNGSRKLSRMLHPTTQCAKSGRKGHKKMKGYQQTALKVTSRSITPSSKRGVGKMPNAQNYQDILRNATCCKYL